MLQILLDHFRKIPLQRIFTRPKHPWERTKKISSFRLKAQTRRKTAGAKNKKETFIPKENPNGENEQKPTDYWGIHRVWLPRRGEKQNRCRQQRRAEGRDPETPPRLSLSRERWPRRETLRLLRSPESWKKTLPISAGLRLHVAIIYQIPQKN